MLIKLLLWFTQKRGLLPLPTSTPIWNVFPDVIGYASTQHILELYGNPRTTLLPILKAMVPDRGEARAMSSLDLRVSGHARQGVKANSHWDINVSSDWIKKTLQGIINLDPRLQRIFSASQAFWFWKVYLKYRNNTQSSELLLMIFLFCFQFDVCSSSPIYSNVTCQRGKMEQNSHLRHQAGSNFNCKKDTLYWIKL